MRRRWSDRSSRRVRTLVTQLARSRLVRESDRMRADIHDGPEQTLQSEAGYSNARPHRQDRRNLLHRTAGPYSRVMTGKAQNEHMFSLRRTKATLIYRRTGTLRAVQLLLGHTKIESTVRYLGIEVDDAADMLCPPLTAALCHVWTAPGWQGLSFFTSQAWSVLPCVRP